MGKGPFANIPFRDNPFSMIKLSYNFVSGINRFHMHNFINFERAPPTDVRSTWASSDIMGINVQKLWKSNLVRSKFGVVSI